jgi:HTH-type transcriptional regulator / antitoxin HigA
MTNQWYILESRKDYEAAIKRFEEISDVSKDSPEFKELLLLVLLINKYENEKWPFPDPDPIEMIKIRMEDLGLTASDLAKEYGDKGTISKVLNYKQPLSLTMIRKFSKLLGLPTDALTREYKVNS